MNQQTAFPAMDTTTPDQIQLARDLNILHGVLGYEFIEIEQLRADARELQGVMVVKYTEIADDDDMLALDSGGQQVNEEDHYPHAIEGGSLKFVKNPYMRRALGTGRVAFLVDDQEELPVNALSGEQRGWNREFLASHYFAGYWKIVDDAIDAEVRERAEKIRDAVRSGALRPVMEADDGDTSRVLDGVDPDDAPMEAYGDGVLREAPGLIIQGPGMDAPKMTVGRVDGLPSGRVVTGDTKVSELEERVGGLERDMGEVKSGIGQILSKLNNPEPDLIAPEHNEEPQTGEKVEPKEDKKPAKKKPGRKKSTSKGVEGGVAG
jgi:hypothetical protein